MDAIKQILIPLGAGFGKSHQHLTTKDTKEHEVSTHNCSRSKICSPTVAKAGRRPLVIQEMGESDACLRNGTYGKTLLNL
jgi:hypothetical protein